MPKDEESQSLLDKENGKTDYSADVESEAIGKNAFVVEFNHFYHIYATFSFVRVGVYYGVTIRWY